jgi:hypothetical protein
MAPEHYRHGLHFRHALWTRIYVSWVLSYKAV